MNRRNVKRESVTEFCGVGLFDSLLSSIAERIGDNVEGGVRIPWDFSHYWFPQDYARWERLFHEYLELRVSNRRGLSREECQRRDAEADRIKVELERIKDRQIPITDPEIVRRREDDEARIEQCFGIQT